MSHQMRACKHSFSFSSDRNRSNPKACNTCAMEQRIAELEAERDQFKAQLGQVRDLFIEIDICEDYIHQFEGAENCELCIPRTAEIWKLLGITP